MPPAGSEEPISEALSAAVLGDENTLSLVLTLGALSASDLASAAQVARVWRRAARLVGARAPRAPAAALLARANTESWLCSRALCASSRRRPPPL